MKLEFNVDRATFILGVCGVTALAINVTKSPWWIFGLLFLSLWAIFKEKHDGEDDKKRDGSDN